MAYVVSVQEDEERASTCVRNERLFYDLAEMLVCDPVASSRAGTRSALYSLGCRRIEICGNLRDFLEALENRPPDVALCEAQVGEAELCRALRDLRHGHGYNPFAIVIVTAWKPSAALVTQILATGADGVLARPFSTALLDQRIRAHVLQQRPFVVTDDYIGPERRSSGRHSEPLSIARPNSLRVKLDHAEHSEEAIHRFNTDLRAACTELMAARRHGANLKLHD
jgi:DNA-binding NarL/FixJ family response regulator